MFSLYLNLALHCVNAFQNDVTLQTLQTMVKECYLHFLLARFWFSSGLTPWLSRHIQLIGFTYMNGGTYHSEMHGAPWDADAEDFHLWQAMTPFLFFKMMAVLLSSVAMHLLLLASYLLAHPTLLMS